MQHKSLDIVFGNVKSMLRKYEALGLIGDSDLYRWAKFILKNMGLFTYIKKELVLDIENYKVELPEDFSYLWAVNKCEDCGNTTHQPIKLYFGRPQTFEVHDYVQRVCYDKCDVHYDNTKQIVTRVYETKGLTHTENFCNRTLLKCSSKVPKDKCHTKCPNLNCSSPHEFNIDDKQLYFNFKEGTIHLQYFAFPFDEDGYPMIPDDIFIEKAIEDYMIYQVFLQIYYNSEVDVKERVQASKIEHINSLKEARYNAKLPSFQELVDWGSEIPKSLKIFNLESKADGIFK